MERIPVDCITDFYDNVRHEETDAHLSTLAADIEERGLLHPITVRRREDGQSYEVVAGKRRLAAHRLLSRPDIPAIVVDASDGEGFLISLSENMHRHPMTNKDRCLAIRRCYDECGGNLPQVMEITHLSESTVRRYLEISQLPEHVMDRLDAQGGERITLKEAYEMAHPPPEPESTTNTINDTSTVVTESGTEKKSRKKSLKTEPWVYDDEGKPVAIPESLYGSVYAMVTRMQ